MAPKRIYLQWHGDGDPADEGEIDEAAVTWSRHREFEHDIRYTRTDIFMDAIARAEAAEKRVQELEAQLAAQAWRPVDDLDLDRGSDVDILARGHYDPEMGGVMLDSRDFLLSDGEDFIAWRPRTTSPIDPPAPA